MKTSNLSTLFVKYFKKLLVYSFGIASINSFAQNQSLSEYQSIPNSKVKLLKTDGFVASTTFMGLINEQYAMSILVVEHSKLSIETLAKILTKEAFETTKTPLQSKKDTLMQNGKVAIMYYLKFKLSNTEFERIICVAKDTDSSAVLLMANLPEALHTTFFNKLESILVQAVY